MKKVCAINCFCVIFGILATINRKCNVNSKKLMQKAAKSMSFVLHAYVIFKLRYLHLFLIRMNILAIITTNSIKVHFAT